MKMWTFGDKKKMSYWPNLINSLEFSKLLNIYIVKIIMIFFLYSVYTLTVYYGFFYYFILYWPCDGENQ